MMRNYIKCKRSNTSFTEVRLNYFPIVASIPTAYNNNNNTIIITIPDDKKKEIG